jgi:hypothetical protein
MAILPWYRNGIIPDTSWQMMGRGRLKDGGEMGWGSACSGWCHYKRRGSHIHTPGFGDPYAADMRWTRYRDHVAGVSLPGHDRRDISWTGSAPH